MLVTVHITLGAVLPLLPQQSIHEPALGCAFEDLMEETVPILSEEIPQSAEVNCKVT